MHGVTQRGGGKRSTDVLDTVDVGIGIVGFFAFAFLVITVVCELTGTDALGWALALLAFVLILTALMLFRRRIVQTRRDAEASAPSATR